MTDVTDSDFYSLELLLDPDGRQLLHRVREFMEKEIEPVINRYWTREEFPHDLIPAMSQLGVAGLPYTGYGCGGGGHPLDGMVSLGLGRGDPPVATFPRVHRGLALGWILLCGPEAPNHPPPPAPH